MAFIQQRIDIEGKAGEGVDAANQRVRIVSDLNAFKTRSIIIVDRMESGKDFVSVGFREIVLFSRQAYSVRRESRDMSHAQSFHASLKAHPAVRHSQPHQSNVTPNDAFKAELK